MDFPFSGTSDAHGLADGLSENAGNGAHFGQQPEKMRIVQELVPGKQITMAHIIASPDPVIYKKLGLDPSVDYQRSAIGILTMSPSEVSVIAGDVAIKAASVDLGFIDRFSGTLIMTGRVAEVEAAIAAIISFTKETLGFTVCPITRT